MRLEEGKELFRISRKFSYIFFPLIFFMIFLFLQKEKFFLFFPKMVDEYSDYFCNFDIRHFSFSWNVNLPTKLTFFTIKINCNFSKNFFFILVWKTSSNLVEIDTHFNANAKFNASFYSNTLPAVF